MQDLVDAYARPEVLTSRLGNAQVTDVRVANEIITLGVSLRGSAENLARQAVLKSCSFDMTLFVTV